MRFPHWKISGRGLRKLADSSVEFSYRLPEVQSDGTQSLRNRRQRYALFVGFWTVLAIFSGLSIYGGQLVMGPGVPWYLALRRGFEEWYSWGLLSVGVLWMARHFPFEPGRTRRWVAIHMTAATIATVLFVSMYSFLLHGQRSILDGTLFTFPTVFKKMIVHYCFFNITIYWLILGAHHGWDYYQRYRERERQASALATELVRARLDMLRMQLNPHFLFNTLNAISALIHDHPETADRMVVRLSELLRRTLDLGESQEVPLAQELDFLQGYLDIERIRFEDRLTVEIQVESKVRDALVPAMILQPLVENAIRHGIEPREDPGRIKISAMRIGDMLEMKVCDNGPGLPESDTAPVREGVGLSNTRSRLAHLYGCNHQFQLTPATGGGLEVRLTFPLRTEPAACERSVVVIAKSPSEDPISKRAK